jgi:hypothetical protein
VYVRSELSGEVVGVAQPVLGCAGCNTVQRGWLVSGAVVSRLACVQPNVVLVLASPVPCGCHSSVDDLKLAVTADAAYSRLLAWEFGRIRLIPRPQ